ncbi:hypothetical protein PM082_012259 [Marasmius tenuissimus]|nr:hypothetical protein PM082_012259 [Marasmius tenuissimus]
MVPLHIVFAPLVLIAAAAGVASSKTVQRLDHRADTTLPSFSGFLEKGAPECKSTCQDIFGNLSACIEDATCICTQRTMDNAGSCLNCMATSLPQDISAFQRAISNTILSCGVDDGIVLDVPIIHANGSPGNGALPTPSSALGSSFALVITTVLVGML